MHAAHDESVSCSAMLFGILSEDRERNRYSLFASRTFACWQPPTLSVSQFKFPCPVAGTNAIAGIQINIVLPATVKRDELVLFNIDLNVTRSSVKQIDLFFRTKASFGLLIQELNTCF